MDFTNSKPKLEINMLPFYTQPKGRNSSSRKPSFQDLNPFPSDLFTKYFPSYWLINQKPFALKTNLITYSTIITTCFNTNYFKFNLGISPFTFRFIHHYESCNKNKK